MSWQFWLWMGALLAAIALAIYVFWRIGSRDRQPGGEW